MTRTKLIVLSLFTGPLACSSGGNMNIGDTQGSQLSDYAAHWDGYAEAFQFQPSGSDHVRLTLDASGSGTLQVGDGDAIAPPTDPSVGYPQGISQVINQISLYPNFPYPAHAAQVQTDRIQIGINTGDLEAAWCALQTPIASQQTTTTTSDGHNMTTPGASDAGTVTTNYNCLPNTGFTIGSNCSINAPDGTQTPVDCDKVYLCDYIHVCSCTATSCTIPMPAADATPDQYTSELDGALDTTGTNLTGTLNINGTRVTVHLTRQ